MADRLEEEVNRLNQDDAWEWFSQSYRFFRRHAWLGEVLECFVEFVDNPKRILVYAVDDASLVVINALAENSHITIHSYPRHSIVGARIGCSGITSRGLLTLNATLSATITLTELGSGSIGSGPTNQTLHLAAKGREDGEKLLSFIAAVVGSPPHAGVN